MEVAKKTQASKASLKEAESSIWFTEDASIVRNDWTLLVTHIESKEAEEEVPVVTVDARKIALN